MLRELANSQISFHVLHLADVDEQISGGIIREKIQHKSVLEQRWTAFTGHILIGLAIIPVIYNKVILLIPLPLMDGIFMFLAVTSLYDNHVLERALLLITDKAAYQSTTYIKKVPMNRIHLFTLFRFWWG